MHPTTHLSRNNSTLAKKAITTSKAKKTQSKIPLLLLDPLNTQLCQTIYPNTQTHSTTHMQKQFRFDITKPTHLFDTVSKLETQNRTKAAILEFVLLQLLEREGELWQIKNKSKLVDHYGSPTKAYTTNSKDCIKMKLICQRNKL